MGEQNIELSGKEYERYRRQINLPEFGEEGQQKLKAAKVLVVGCGGLGCPVLLYLAAAGVGTLGIVDFDMVDASNLHRQVLFNVSDQGLPKVEATRKRLQGLNPHVSINTFPVKLSSQNALSIFRGYDVIVDGTDNFPARYLVNDASVLLNKPNVYASIFRFEGQVAVFNHTNKAGETGPNYRDLYPTPPLPGTVPTCAEAGVLGVLPGIIGCMQANEVIKIITGIGEVLSGRLFLFDALNFATRSFQIFPNKDNPINGQHPTITRLIDYEKFCGIKEIKEITVEELETWKRSEQPLQVIDVREPEEYAEFNIGGELIPMSILESNVDKISRDKKVVIHCKTGSRSAIAIRELEEKFGFNNLYNLKGGISALATLTSPHNPLSKGEGAENLIPKG